MKVKRLVQFSAGFNPGDAISNQILMLDSFAKKNGLETSIYSENISPQATKIAKKYKSYTPKKGDRIVYHHSIHSATLEKIYSIPPEITKILIYHNVTPEEFFYPYNLKLAYYAQKGREELKEIPALFQSAIANSHYSALELYSNGFRNVQVLPICLNYKNYTKYKRTNPKKTLLFTGRIAPNKKQTDLVKIAKILNDYFTEDFELIMVGKTTPEMFSYKQEILELIEYFHLKDKVKLTEFLEQEELNWYYSNADVFICMSEHEGFCVPLLEAMYYNIPIVAYNQAAVPETLRESGILFHKKDFFEIAKTIFALFQNQVFRKKIIEKQTQVLEYYQSLDYEREFLNTLTLKSEEADLDQLLT